MELVTERVWVLPPGQDGKPRNAPARHSFRLAELIPCLLPEWPPTAALGLGWDEAVATLQRHWAILCRKPFWTPYPILSYCLAFAQGSPASAEIGSEAAATIRRNRGPEAPDELISVSFFLFPCISPRAEGQAIAKLICMTADGASPGNVGFWVDALGESELDDRNRRDIQRAKERGAKSIF